MVIRIRFGAGPKVATGRRKNRRAAQVLAVALTPLAAMALAMACWGIASYLDWTSSFVIPSGLFSHWQVWLGAAGVLQLCSRVLNRYGKDPDAQAS
jgi:hypothetical protein